MFIFPFCLSVFAKCFIVKNAASKYLRFCSSLFSARGNMTETRPESIVFYYATDDLTLLITWVLFSMVKVSLSYINEQKTNTLTNHSVSLGKKATIHQVTNMLATSKNVLFQVITTPLTTGTDDPSLYLSPSLALGDNQNVGSSAPVVSRWL